MIKFTNNLKNFLFKPLTLTFNTLKITSMLFNSKKCFLLFFNSIVIISSSIKPKYYKNILNCFLNFSSGKIFLILTMEMLVKKQLLLQINNFNNFLNSTLHILKKQNLLRSIPNFVKQEHKHHFLSQQRKIWIIWLLSQLVLSKNKRNFHLCPMTQHLNLPLKKIGKIVK